MVDLKKILKKLEELESPEEKIEYLQELFNSLKDEDEKKEFIEILNIIFPEEDQESLEQIIQPSTQRFSRPTIPDKPQIVKEESLEDLIPKTEKKQEEDTSKYTASRDSIYQDAAQVYVYKTSKYETRDESQQATKNYSLVDRDQVMFRSRRDEPKNSNFEEEERLKNEKNQRYKLVR